MFKTLIQLLKSKNFLTIRIDDTMYFSLIFILLSWIIFFCKKIETIENTWKFYEQLTLTFRQFKWPTPHRTISYIVGKLIIPTFRLGLMWKWQLFQLPWKQAYTTYSLFFHFTIKTLNLVQNLDKTVEIWKFLNNLYW